MWLLTEGHCLRAQVTQPCRGPEDATKHGVQFESGSLETLRHLVDRVGSITLLPLLATHYLGGGAALRVRPFEAPAPGRTVRLARPRGSAKHRLIDALATVVRESAGLVLGGLSRTNAPH